MDTENVNPQEDVVEEEGQTSTEETTETQEETVTIPKAKFTNMQRKAIAFDSIKTKPQKTLPIKQEPIDDEIIKTVKSLENAEKKRQFGYEHGLSPEETDKVFQVSGGKPSADTLKDPFVIAGLEAIRASKRIENNTPGSSSGAKLYAGKEFSELSPKEKQKAWEEEMKGVRK